MNSSVNWTNAARLLGLFLVGLGAVWHDDTVIGIGVGVFVSPEGAALKK